jgi:eukaryotic-like serine/threonine-protein kinase
VEGDLSMALHYAGHLDQGLEHERRCREIFGGMPAAQDNVGLSWAREAEILKDLGRPAQSRQAAEQSLQVLSDALGHASGKSHITYYLAEPWMVLGDLELKAGRIIQAKSDYEQAETLRETSFPSDSDSCSTSLTGIAEADLGLRRPAEALPLLEKAFRARKAQRRSTQDDARTDFALARALWETNGDRVRASALAHDALTVYSELPDYLRKDRSEVERWLSAHPH